mmetsp:Transcript_2044/g.5087  ORF Transcript_2044/g.5087 Transcript_2044/m.5087 type:complete len:128 (+) Transcript_2044:798-1181(+)
MVKLATTKELHVYARDFPSSRKLIFSIGPTYSDTAIVAAVAKLVKTQGQTAQLRAETMRLGEIDNIRRDNNVNLQKETATTAANERKALAEAQRAVAQARGEEAKAEILESKVAKARGGQDRRGRCS